MEALSQFHVVISVLIAGYLHAYHNKAHIWACSNNMNLHSFKEPIPTVYVLILNKCKCERNYLVVAIYTDYGGI